MADGNWRAGEDQVLGLADGADRSRVRGHGYQVLRFGVRIVLLLPLRFPRRSCVQRGHGLSAPRRLQLQGNDALSAPRRLQLLGNDALRCLAAQRWTACICSVRVERYH